MQAPLQGRRALVTGGVRRLGNAFALALQAAGAEVVVTTRTPGGDGAGLRVIRCDVTSPDDIAQAVQEAAALLGGIDILVNNAGAFETAPLESLTPAQWDAMYAVNTRGPFLVAQAALPWLRMRQGRVINIGSLGGMLPWATHGHYCASKAALHMLSKTMAKAWAPLVSVNCVAPGMIVFPGEEARLASKTPMQRDGSPDDAVSAVLYFAGAPAFITGQVLAVDGGLSL